MNCLFRISFHLFVYFFIEKYSNELKDSNDEKLILLQATIFMRLPCDQDDAESMGDGQIERVRKEARKLILLSVIFDLVIHIVSSLNLNYVSSVVGRIWRCLGILNFHLFYLSQKEKEKWREKEIERERGVGESR